MKILLINPVITTHRDELQFPLNLIYLASALKQSGSGIEPVPLDLTFEHFSTRSGNTNLMESQYRCIDRVWQEQGPFDLAGLGGLCDNFHLSVRLAQYLKKKYGIPIVLGGPHATFVAEDILTAFPFVDYVIRNDGAAPLLALCRDLHSLPESIPDLLRRGPNGAVIPSPRRTEAADTLSVEPDYTLLPLDKYLKINPDRPIPVLAGAGCPYRCSYCSTSLMWDRRYRVIAPELIASRVLGLKKRFPQAWYSLVHDNLLCGRPFALRLCTQLARTGAEWGGSSRLEHLDSDPAFMRRLNRAGCRSLFVGIESGSPRMQKVMGKNISVASVIPLARDLLRSGLNPVFSFILGFPQETDKDRDDTIRLAFAVRTLGAERINLNHLFPLPGTELAKKYPVGRSRELRYRAPQLAADSSSRKLILGNPGIFRSFLPLPDRQDATPLTPEATERFHTLCVENYRAFNYLFSKTKLRPSELFPELACGKTPNTLFALIRRRAGPGKFKVFHTLLSYERLLARLASGRRASPSRPATFDPRRACRLASTAVLFKAPFRLHDVLTPQLPDRLPAPGPVYMCLVDKGTTVETFEVEPQLFAALQRLKRGKQVPRELAQQAGDRKAAELIRRSIKDLFRLGALSYE